MATTIITTGTHQHQTEMNTGLLSFFFLLFFFFTTLTFFLGINSAYGSYRRLRCHEPIQTNINSFFSQITVYYCLHLGVFFLLFKFNANTQCRTQSRYLVIEIYISNSK